MLGNFISAATAYSLQQGPFHECSAGKPLLHLPRESSCRRMSLVFKGDETGTLDISEKNIDYVFAACDKDIDRLIANAVTIRGMAAEENCPPHGDERSEKSLETALTNVSEPTNDVRVCANITKDTRDKTYLQTPKAYLYAPNGNYTKIMCLFDTGSQRSFVTKGVADSLGLTGLNERMCISTLGNKTCHKKLRRVSFSLKEITPNSQAKQINAYCVNRICDTWEENPPVMWEHAKDLNLADDFPRDRCDVDVLIRIDYYYHFIEDDRRSVVDEWLVALTNYTDTVKVLRIDVRPQCDCEKYRSFWELESIGIMDQPETESPIKRSMIISRTLLSFHKNRYVTRLFWKHNDALPNNYYAALKRFEQFEARLRKGPSKKRECENTLQEYIKNRYVEEIGNLGGREKKIWYLPHHAVFKMEKSTSKCRIVFDGSHLCGGVSLNERHHENVPTNRIALSRSGCDKICMAETRRRDATYLSVLSIAIWVMLFTFFGYECRSRSSSESSDTATEVLRNMYVDDILLSCDDESTAQKMVAELTKLLKIGSFELSKWSSNCTDVLSSTPQTEVTTNCSKALGMNWEHSTDTFQFPVPSENEIASCNTKRSLLSVFFKIFEILGWLSPFVVRVKILLQRLWQQGIDWEMDSIITNTGVNEKYTMKQETNQPERYITSTDYAKLNRRRNCLKGRMNRVCQDLEALIRQPESRIDVKMTLDPISKLLERCQEAQNAVEAVITDDDEIEKETQRWMDFEREIRSARGRAEKDLEMNTEP
ncbi:hypothetical protein T03_3246 [Trichinella britovi]|uniref:DUF1758 domain-containing protein n=1 Tax=Trichinella britovi TaxID=45882 RepID=A0A0V1CGW6_TRIBR|nr:hypothetical protein T03_3246 [Trichinella britovi]